MNPNEDKVLFGTKVLECYQWKEQMVQGAEKKTSFTHIYQHDLYPKLLEDYIECQYQHKDADG